jgi:hypothetical protein
MVRAKTFLIVVVFIICACSQKKKFTLVVTSEKPYCGGAKPTAEMIKAAKKPVLFSNKTLVLVRTDGIIDSVRTDSAGKLNLKLAHGTYHLFESWRHYKTSPGKKDLTGFDKDCLLAEWDRPNKIIVVSRSGFQVKDSATIVQYCDWRLPCLAEGSNVNVPQ